MFDRLVDLIARLPFVKIERPPVVPVVRLVGMIAPAGMIGRALSLATVAGGLEAAFGVRGAKAVALIVNSPGGSPAQSALIARRIRSLAEEKKLPVHVFVEDLAASGGYWLACAGDDIHADASSIVGSIGVVSAGFGFTGLLEKWGVERRVHTSGSSKSQLDPFRPENPDDVARLRALQDEIHVAFKDWVRERRATRLKGDDATLFEGEYWTGRRALELGLIDGVGHLRDTLRARYGEKVRTPLVGERRGFSLRRLIGLEAAIPAPDAVADALIDAADRRAAWARYGL
ncbi:MAG: S49 family peptidase [Rhodospirillales bacterium]|nr:S49 family peptidase [Rhodospirillales bacterium]QQS14025.1 MAG: S49 family peptidase [Rhodospirillales bacterium]